MSDLNDALRTANAGGDLPEALDDAKVSPAEVMQAVKAARGEHQEEDDPSEAATPD